MSGSLVKAADTYTLTLIGGETYQLNRLQGQSLSQALAAPRDHAPDFITMTGDHGQIIQIKRTLIGKLEQDTIRQIGDF